MNQKIIYSSALLVGLGSPQAFAHKEKAHTPQKPNIIFIMCDDMGYGDLGCYGQPYISTPNIDNMAREGMRFTQAYAGSPVSAPSRASLMTGQHTGHCEVRGNKEYWTQASTVMYGDNKEFSVVGQHPYDPEHVILPEIMKDNVNGRGDTKARRPLRIKEESMNITDISVSFRHISIIPIF